MSTTTTDVRRRSETDMAAEVMWVLIASGRVPKEPSWLQAACADVRVALDDIASAMKRLGGRPKDVWIPPRPDFYAQLTLDVGAAGKPVSLASTPTTELAPIRHQARQHRQARPLLRPATTTRKTRGDELWCRRHDNSAGAWVHQEFFSLRADRPGKYRAWCDECTAAYQRAKYLSTSTLEALFNEGVRVSDLPPGAQPLVKDPCPVCLKAFNPDDVVVGVHTPIVVHKGCGCP